MKFSNGTRSATCHSSSNFCSNSFDNSHKWSSCRYAWIDSLFKCIIRITKSVSLFSCSLGSLAPIISKFVAINDTFWGWTFITCREESSMHHHISSHRKCKNIVVILRRSTIRNKRNIDACFCEICITCLSDIHQCRCLSSTYGFLQSSDTYLPSSDADFYRVRASINKKLKRTWMDDISRNNRNIGSEALNILDCVCLPFTKSVGSVYHQNIRTSVKESSNTFPIISCINSCTDQNPLFLDFLYHFRLFFWRLWLKDASNSSEPSQSNGKTIICHGLHHCWSKGNFKMNLCSSFFSRQNCCKWNRCGNMYASRQSRNKEKFFKCVGCIRKKSCHKKYIKKCLAKKRGKKKILSKNCILSDDHTEL